MNLRAGEVLEKNIKEAFELVGRGFAKWEELNEWEQQMKLELEQKYGEKRK